MSGRLFLWVAIPVLVIAAIVGVWWATLLPPMRLTRIGFADLPGWQAADKRPALDAFRRSCAMLQKLPPSQQMGGAGYVGNVGDWLGLCASMPEHPDAKAAQDFFEHGFVPFAVRGRGTSLFTGYYEPEIKGSRTRHGAFQTPVYARPDDLIDVNLGQFSPEWQGEHTAGRVQGHALVPYATRADIDKEELKPARVLFYTADPVAFFFLQIQGSGRVRFDDGSVARIAYDGQNGRPYTAIGRSLIAAGELARSDVSLASIRAWLLAHPVLARAMMETDQSFVFFRQTPIGDPALGSPGAEGADLTPEASIAVDTRFHALGEPFYVATEVPGVSGAWDRLLIAQDVGGAIRGAVRGDLFFGFGGDAEARAGGMKAPSRLYVLLPDAVATRLGGGKDFQGPVQNKSP